VEDLEIGHADLEDVFLEIMSSTANGSSATLPKLQALAAVTP